MSENEKPLNMYKMPNHNSLAWRIFTLIWEVKIPASYTMNSAIDRYMGTRVGNDMKRRDEALKTIINEDRLVMISLDKMAELVEAGASIKLVHVQDSLEMYQLLIAYLEHADGLWKNSLALFRPPIEGLKLFDRLAELLYPCASLFMEAKDLTVGFTSFMNAHGAFDKGFQLQSHKDLPLLKKPTYTYVSPLSSNIGEVAMKKSIGSWQINAI
jgi:hypothetical protein